MNSYFRDFGDYENVDEEDMQENSSSTPANTPKSNSPRFVNRIDPNV